MTSALRLCSHLSSMAQAHARPFIAAPYMPSTKRHPAHQPVCPQHHALPPHRMLGGASRKGYGAQQQALLEEDAARRLRFSGVTGEGGTNLITPSLIQVIFTAPATPSSLKLDCTRAGADDDATSGGGGRSSLDTQTDRDSLGGGASCDWRSSLDGSETCSTASLDDDQSVVSLEDGGRGGRPGEALGGSVAWGSVGWEGGGVVRRWVGVGRVGRGEGGDTLHRGGWMWDARVKFVCVVGRRGRVGEGEEIGSWLQRRTSTRH